MLVKRKKYTVEFKEEAAKLVLEKGYTHAQAAENLGVSTTNIGRWVIAHQEQPGGSKKPKAVSIEQAELEALRKENKRLKLEREILKKAAAFFASEAP
jgi:transposase